MVKEHKALVYNTCLGFVHKQNDAEDLSQEVFIEAFKNWDAFRGESNVKTWLYRIAINKSLEHLRSLQRLKRKGNHLEIFEDSVITYEHPGILLENQERSNILMQQIRMLPEQQQTAFILHKIEGLSYEEIGKVMKKTVSSVESLMHRAKHQLKTKLQHYYVNS